MVAMETHFQGLKACQPADDSNSAGQFHLEATGGFHTSN